MFPLVSLIEKSSSKSMAAAQTMKFEFKRKLLVWF